MVRFENQCVDCTAKDMPCLGSSCPYRDVPIYFCDTCGEEISGEVYEVDGEDVCEHCLKRMFRKDVW